MDISIFQINIEHQSMYLKMQENCGWINEQFFDKNLINTFYVFCVRNYWRENYDLNQKPQNHIKVTDEKGFVNKCSFYLRYKHIKKSVI